MAAQAQGLVAAAAGSIGAEAVGVLSLLPSPEHAEYAATMCSAFFFLSPSVQMIQLFRSRGASLNTVNPITMNLMFFNCALWLIWGLCVPVPAAVPANLLGFVASVAYLLICWGFVLIGGARAAAWEQRAALSTGGAVASSVLLTGYASISTPLAQHVGYLGMAICVCLFAAPLSELAKVLAERNSDRLPPLQCFMQFWSTALWLLIGLRQGAVQIIVCNFLGLVLAIVQVSLIIVLPSGRARKTEKPGDLRLP